tara:strand:- start:1864 stop:1998 length:135 start_codon:yes stop_codon:yes gene_type:complete
MANKYRKAIKEMNRQFKPRGIIFKEAGEGWKQYKESIKGKGKEQ